jgi:hypothetical protein
MPGDGQNINDGQYQNAITALPKLTMYDFENIFKIYLDDSTQTLFYNIASTLFFPSNLAKGAYYIYKVTGNNMSWTYLSHILYGTIDLWWVLCILNNVNNPMIFPAPGTNLNVLTPDTLRMVIQQIQQNQ